ncbi:MAG: Nucleoside symporter [Planctomycetota bacterium]|nr:Nucleoside symporter [Planctomycetota bacterium]
MGTRTRLAIMMGLVYGIQGAWWPMLALHLTDLGVSGRGRGWIFATLSISALLTPPLAGRVADRRIPAQRLLALIYAIGTVLLAAAASGLATTFAGLFPLFLAYWLLTAPYLGLTNTVAMRNLDRPREQFGGIRMWGTVGWMAAGWAVSGVLAKHSQGATTVAAGPGIHQAFWIACALSSLAVVCCLLQPNTPPLATGSRGLPWTETAALIRKPGVAVLLITGFGVSLTTPFVYQAVPVYLREAGLSQARVGSALSLGQVLEILALGLLPIVLGRLGRRTTMCLGIAAWVVYHGLFAMRPTIPVALLAITLNGIAIAFFHVAAPMYLDSQAPGDHRAGAQSLWVMITSGLGSLTGTLLAGEVIEYAAGDWRFVFAIPTAINVTLLLGFLLSFRPVEVARAGQSKGHPQILPTAFASRARTLSAENHER